MRPIHRLAVLAVLAVLLSTLPSQADFKAEDKNGRIEIRDHDNLVFGWQYQLRKDAVGGETNPLFPALRSSPTFVALRAMKVKRLLQAGRSGQCLFQEPPAKNKFLAVQQKSPATFTEKYLRSHLGVSAISG
ncbi:MAG: hypothetical protein OSA84_12395 [Akkermansiaceae bacterium]|nr:hypothetical protein [Akkermansiaceae bacterium]